MKFEIGYHIGRVRRDQRRGRHSRRWVSASESPGLPVRILEVYREVLTGSSQTVPPRQSQHPLLKAASLKLLPLWEQWTEFIF